MATNTSQKTVFTGKEQLNLRLMRTVGPVEKNDFCVCLNVLVLMVFKILNNVFVFVCFSSLFPLSPKRRRLMLLADRSDVTRNHGNFSVKGSSEIAARTQQRRMPLFERRSQSPDFIVFPVQIEVVCGFISL